MFCFKSFWFVCARVLSGSSFSPSIQCQNFSNISVFLLSSDKLLVLIGPSVVVFSLLLGWNSLAYIYIVGSACFGDFPLQAPPIFCIQVNLKVALWFCHFSLKHVYRVKFFNWAFKILHPRLTQTILISHYICWWQYKLGSLLF